MGETSDVQAHPVIPSKGLTLRDEQRAILRDPPLYLHRHIRMKIIKCHENEK